MLKYCRFIVLFIGGLSLMGSALAWAAQGYIFETRGDVKAATGTALPLTVKKDQLIPDNTTITVGPKSSATLKFEDGTIVLLNESSSFQIQKYAYDEKDSSRISALFSLLKGGLRAVTGLISSRNREAFRVKTPLATIGIRGTEFMAQLTPSNQIYMQVLVGRVELANIGGTGIFSAGQTAFVPTPTARPAPVSAPPRGMFGAMPAAKLPPPVPVKAPAAAKTAAKSVMTLEQAKTELRKAPADLAKKVAELADNGVSASVIIAAIAEVADKNAVIAAIAMLIAKGADPAEVTSAAIAAGADAAAVTAAAVKAAPNAAAAIVAAAVRAGAPSAAVQAAAIGAGADPTTVTTAAAAGQPAPPPPAQAPATAAPSSTPVPGGGGSGTPVSPS